MRTIITVCLAVVSVFAGYVRLAAAEAKAELVSQMQVWDGAKHVVSPDLVRFGDRWFLACMESPSARWPRGEIRVLTSTDGKAWKSAALIQSPTPERGLYGPAFTLVPDGRLMLSALGVLPYPGKALPTYGGLLKTLAWYSKDGRDWGEPTPIGEDNFPLNPIVWHKGTAFSCAEGSICGSAQTIHIMTSHDGCTFERRYEETLSALMPYEAEMLFDGNRAYCLVTGYANVPTGLLGTAESPFKKWKWKKLERQVRLAKFTRLSDKRVIATVGLYDGKARTSLCDFAPATGKFTELLELPTGEEAVNTGLAWHDGHLWVSYPVAEVDKHSLHLARIKLW